MTRPESGYEVASFCDFEPSIPHYIVASWEKIYSVLAESRSDKANTKKIFSPNAAICGIDGSESKLVLYRDFFV